MGLFGRRLIVSGRTVVDDVFVRTEVLGKDSSANLEITGTIKNYEAHDVAAELKLKVEPENFSGVAQTLPTETMTLHPGKTPSGRKSR